MGTREVYEEKLRRGNLHHDPTINPGLGSARCPRCLSLINPKSEKEEWTINSVLHDATFVAGSGAGVMLSAVHGMNIGIPFVQKHVKGPKWLHFLFVSHTFMTMHTYYMTYVAIKRNANGKIPPLLLYSGASASLGAYAVPRFAQLTVTSYYAASSASHYAVSRATRYIEESHSSQSSRDV